MAITKPPVTSVWASTATDNVTPTDAFIAAGWPQSTTPPPRGRFNWLLNYLYNGVRYFSRRGIADWDIAETYLINDKSVGPDGQTYISLTNANTANTPATSPSQWQRWGFAQSDFTGLATANGWRKLPDGTIEQWGIGTTTGGAGAITFPIPFPNTCYGVSLTESQAASWSPTNLGVYGIAAHTLAGATVVSLSWLGSAFSTTSNGNFFWRATGR